MTLANTMRRRAPTVSWGETAVKHALKSGASIIALMLVVPNAPAAAMIGACGVPDTSQNPNVVSCVSDPTNYQNGIIYNQSSFPTPAGLKLDIYGTAIVNANLAGAAVSVTGSTDNAAQIALRSGARITNTGIGAQALAIGTGGALIDNRGTVTAVTGGLLALGDTTGLPGTASVTNQSDGRVLLSPTTGTVYGILALAGSATVVNNGQVTLTSPTGSGTYSGLAVGSHTDGGSASITNAGTVSLTAGGAANAIGLHVISNAGGANHANSGTLSVGTGAGSAIGMFVASSGSGGPTFLSNTGTFSVSSSSGTATGMAVFLGSTVSLSNAQVAAGTTTFTLTGTNLTGFRVANATGAVSLSNSGVAVDLDAGSGGVATFATLSGGTTQSVNLQNMKLGTAVYSGDVSVRAGSNANGIILSGATDAVGITLTGAALSVSSSDGLASGVKVTGGTSVEITTVIDSANARGSAFTVTGGGNGGRANGITLSGATGAQTISIGDSFSVVNTANNGGYALGVMLDDGTTANLSFAKGLSVSGLGAIGVAVGLSTAPSGNVTLTSQDAVTVDGTAGVATGIEINGAAGTSATLASLAVTGRGAIGAWLRGGTGTVSFIGNGTLNVQGGSGSALGVATYGGNDQTILLGQGGVVSGTSATGVIMYNGSGALTLTSSDAFTVVADAGIATGASVFGGTTQALTFAKAVSVASTASSAQGVMTSGDQAALTLKFNDTLTVSSADATALGVGVSGVASASTSYAKTLEVRGATGAIGQVLRTTGTASTTADGAWNVTATTGSAFGGQTVSDLSQSFILNGPVTIQGGTFAGGFFNFGAGDKSITFNSNLSVTASSGSARGVLQVGGGPDSTDTINVLGGATITTQGTDARGFEQGSSSAATFNGTGAISVTSNGLAYGVIQSSGGSNTITLNDTLTVSGSGGAFGFYQAGQGPNLINAKAAISVTSSASNAGGIQVFGNTSNTVNLGGGMAVSGLSSSLSFGVYMAGGAQHALTVTGDLSVNAGATTGSSAWGAYQAGGASATTTVSGALTVTASSEATGASLVGNAGAQSFAAGGLINVTATAGSAYGLNLVGGTSNSIITSKAVTVSAAGEESFGLRSRFASGAVTITAEETLLVTNSAGTATGVQVTSGRDVAVALAKAVTVNASVTGDAYGVVLSGATGLTSVRVPAGVVVRASATSGNAFGIIAVNGAGLTIDPPDVTVNAFGDAAGVYSVGQIGAQNVSLGTISVTSSGATASGVSLSGSGAITLTDLATITANSATGGVGVSLSQTGATAAINATLNAVATTGPRTNGVNLAQSTVAGTTGTIAATIQSVSTTGAGSTGVVMTGSQGGNASLTLGTAAARTGGVTTTGASANGVSAAGINGALAITNNATIAVSGLGSIGIAASGAGAISVNSWNVTTTAGRGIEVAGGGGAVSITSTNVSAAGGDAISVANTGTGAVTVNLADGGGTSSTIGAGVLVNTSGTATINLGSANTTARVSGGTAGIRSTATGGQTVNLSGVVGATSNAAVILNGGATTVVNRGTANGFMTLSSAGNTVTNGGTWNAFGGDTTFGGTSTLTNTGTININPAGSGATTMRFLSLTSLSNGGTISLGNARTGDVLDVGAAAVSGSGSGRIVLDANLGSAAVGASAAQTADMLRTTGASSGTTILVINDLAASQAGQFNFSGIRVVTNGSSAGSGYVLPGGAISKGFVQYVLAQDSGSNWNLIGVPATSAFELVRTGAQAQKFWRRSGDAWAEQMNSTPLARGDGLWMQFYGGGQTDKSSPAYSQTVLGRSVSFSPNLDIRNSWAGLQAGYELGRQTWGIGLTVGYNQQNGTLQSTADQIRIKGGNIGAYLRLRSQKGLYANLLVKADRFSVDYAFAAPASAPSINGTTYGANIEVGAILHSGSVFFQPLAGLSATHTKLDGFTGGAGGMAVQFTKLGSAYGRIGMRLGFETKSDKWAVRPFVGATWDGELSGQSHAVLSSGGTSLDLADASEGGRARIEAGVQATRDAKLSLFAKADLVKGKQAQGVAGRAGLSIRW